MPDEIATWRQIVGENDIVCIVVIADIRLVPRTPVRLLAQLVNLKPLCIAVAWVELIARG